MTAATYLRDAQALLNGKDLALLDRLNAVTNGILLGLTPTPFAVMGWISTASQFTSLAGRLRERYSAAGLEGSRLDSVHRIQSAHDIMVVSSFFEALNAEDSQGLIARSRITKREAERLARSESYPQLVGHATAFAELANSGSPSIGPHLTLSEQRSELERYYAFLANTVLEFLKGLAVYDGLDERMRSQLTVDLATAAGRALDNYESGILELTSTHPEVAVWTSRWSTANLQDQLGDVRNSLSTLNGFLEPYFAQRSPDRDYGLGRHNALVLEEPLVNAGEIADGLTFPTVEDGYIAPRFRAALITDTSQIGDEQFWRSRPIRDDFNQYVAGLLVAEAAVNVPLVVFAQPGRGKTMLTKVLAARLSQSGFLALRVDLRYAVHQDDIQAQLEAALRTVTGEVMTWPEAVRGAQPLRPIVLVDGLDELLLAAPKEGRAYLQRLADFQRRELTHGRPVTVVVTCRIAVSGRLLQPGQLHAAVLECFSVGHVDEWVERFNRLNPGGHVLSLPGIQRQLELAQEPLLLAMLAVWQRQTGALSRSAVQLGEAQFVQRLVGDFVDREARRAREHRDDEDVSVEAARILWILRIAAFSLMARRRVVADVDVILKDIQEFSDMLGVSLNVSKKRGSQLRPEQVLGRFFFVHINRIGPDGRQWRGFEFLHARFGEFLAAEMILTTVERLVQDGGGALVTAGKSSWPLAQVLASVPLGDRSEMLRYLGELASGERDRIAQTLESLFVDSDLLLAPEPSADRISTGASFITRIATLRANCVLFATACLHGFGIATFQIGADDSAYAVNYWAHEILFWKSQLPAHEVEALQRSMVGLGSNLPWGFGVHAVQRRFNFDLPSADASTYDRYMRGSAAPSSDQALDT